MCFFLYFSPNLVVYGQPGLQFKDLGQKKKDDSLCPFLHLLMPHFHKLINVNVNVNVKRCKCSSTHEISQGKKDTGEDGRS